MGIKFIDPKTQKQTGSTELGRAVLSAAVEKIDPNLALELRNETTWRKNYQSKYAKVAQLELSSNNAMLEIAAKGLAEFENRLVTDSGENLLSLLRTSWRSGRDLVSTVVIQGNLAPTQPALLKELSVSDLVERHIAEPGIISSLESLNHSGTDVLASNLLVALAGGAEYSPSRTWLDWGGKVAVVARARTDLWVELISRARNSGGTLLVPVLNIKLNGKVATSLSDEELADVAGLDLVEDYEAISGWLAHLASMRTERLVLGSYAYAPGAKHIEVQGVQHALARVLTENLPKTRVALTWLATPTDSHVVPKEFADDIEKRYAGRALSTKLRDSIFGVHPNIPTHFKTDKGEGLVLIDPTSSVQGSSYALAKRVQRWMAYQQAFADRTVIYLVSPPARTDSVLEHRILRASYRGAPHFGLFPFETKEAVNLSACLLFSELEQQPRLDPADLTSLYTRLAVHGGLWRSIYRPKDLWRAATVRGILGYFK